jgi:hypothetical protein
VKGGCAQLKVMLVWSLFMLKEEKKYLDYHSRGTQEMLNYKRVKKKKKLCFNVLGRCLTFFEKKESKV